MEYTINYRTPAGIDQVHCASLASVLGHIQHLSGDFPRIWVRENPGGSIVLVYDRDGGLVRP